MSNLAGTSEAFRAAPAPEHLLEGVQSADELLVHLARKDPNTFMEYVLKDEMSGRPISQASLHETWQNLVTARDRVLIWSHIESGKTSQLSIGRTLWEIGNDPTLRIAIVSNTHEQSGKIVRAIAKYIEQSSELRQVFPKMERAEPWTGSQLTVTRPVVSKDPSIQATGIHGNITGARIDRLILDDMLDYENTKTPGLRQELWDWYHATLVGRLTSRAKILVVGTAYHPDDFLHRLAKQGGWEAFRYPILDPETGVSRWPDRWPLSRIESKKQELGPLEFARQMLCQARDDAEARFKKEWIDVAISRGVGKDMAFALESVPPGCKVYTGVDLAVQKHSAADKTVFFSILVHPDKSREVLWIDSGKFSGPQIVQKIVEAHQRFHSIIMVENNSAQDFILQFTRGSFAVPVRPFTTGRNKANPEFGVESLAAEMAGGKWIIPNKNGRIHPEVSEWITEMLYYDPTAHTGDRLMASWFAREGARQGGKRVEMGHIDTTSR